MTNQEKKVLDCVIIGAGPSGLSIGYHLSKSKVDYLIIEKYKTGNSWKNMVDSLHLVSPWWTNTLPGSFFNPFIAYKKHSKGEYLSYLVNYSKKNNLNILENTSVENISYNNEIYYVSTPNGTFYSKSVVIATGYYTNPYIPIITKHNDQSIPSMHASEFINKKSITSRFPNTKKILVVGKRVTAGQLFVELYQLGYHVNLSIRGVLDIKANDNILGIIKEQIYFVWEYFRIKFQPDLITNSLPEMDGGESRKLIKSNKVKVLKLFDKISLGGVYINGKPDKYDLIIYATGYKPELSLLNGLNNKIQIKDRNQIEHFQSKENKGLFFLGLDNLKNFRSRYLRGIASDSKILAKLLFKFLNK